MQEASGVEMIDTERRKDGQDRDLTGFGCGATLPILNLEL
jgi:hypothetical protein